MPAAALHELTAARVLRWHCVSSPAAVLAAVAASCAAYDGNQTVLQGDRLSSLSASELEGKDSRHGSSVDTKRVDGVSMFQAPSSGSMEASHISEVCGQGIVLEQTQSFKRPSSKISRVGSAGNVA